MPSAKSGKAVKVVKPKKAQKVDQSDKAKSGKATSGPKAGAPKKKTKAPKKNNVGLYAPKKEKENPPAPTKKAPEKKSDKPCGIAEMLLQDKEGRKPSDSGLLQVVPKPADGGKIKHSWFELVEIETTKGGTEAIKLFIQSKDGKPVGRKQTCVITSGDPAESDWKDGASNSVSIPAPANKDIWPRNSDPVMHYAYGRGCDDCVTSVTLEVFPSQNYAVKIDAKELQDFIDAMRGGFGGLMAHLFRSKAEEDEDATDFDVKGSKKKEECKTAIELAWGWLEDPKDWRVYYGVEVGVSSGPIFSVGWEPRLSLAQIFLTANGVPPSIAKVLADNLADVYFQAKLSFALDLKGSAKFRFYTYGENKHSGNVLATGKGGLELLMGAHIGSDWVVNVLMEGGGRSAITTSGELEGSSEGLTLEVKIGVDPVTLFVSIKLKAFKRTVKDKEKTWELGGPWEIYPPEGTDPIKLLPREKKK
jgi:hypothetical protein